LSDVLWRSAFVRRAERLSHPGGNLMAEIECQVLSLGVDSTGIAHHAASGLFVQRLNSPPEGRRASRLSQDKAQT
jgi:hypothetical protein